MDSNLWPNLMHFQMHTHTHLFGKGTDRDREREKENLHNGCEDRSAKAKHTTPKNPTVSHRIASHCEPKRTGLQRSIAQFMQIQSQSLAALLVAFYDGLHELQVLEREREQSEREGEREKWQSMAARCPSITYVKAPMELLSGNDAPSGSSSACPWLWL